MRVYKTHAMSRRLPCPRTDDSLALVGAQADDLHARRVTAGRRHEHALQRVPHTQHRAAQHVVRATAQARLALAARHHAPTHALPVGVRAHAGADRVLLLPVMLRRVGKHLQRNSKVARSHYDVTLNVSTARKRQQTRTNTKSC